MKKLLIITFLLVIAGVGYYAFNEYNRGVESNADAKSDVTISANELLTEFQTNEEGANAKYLDKVVEVSGEVSVVEDAEGKTVVRLNAADGPSGVTCELGENPKRKAFAQGEMVTFKCTCTGYLMDVVLVNCAEK